MSYNQETEIGIGVIGLGDVAFYHLPALKSLGQSKGVNLVGLYDLLPEKTKEKAQEFQCQAFLSAEALITHPLVNAVFVLTPHEVHFSNVKMALEAGKHVLVEKPVGTSVAEIEEMKRLAGQKGLVCMPGHNNIYHPGIQSLKESITEGAYGDLCNIDIRYNIYHQPEVANKYPGIIQQVITHHCYTLLYLAGKPKTVIALGSTQHDPKYNNVNNASALFQMENGAHAILQASFITDDHTSDPWSLYMKVIGTDGGGRFSHNDDLGNKKGLVHSHLYLTYPRTLKNEDAHFIDCIRGQQQPLSTLDDAILVEKMLEGIEQSIDEKRLIQI